MTATSPLASQLHKILFAAGASLALAACSIAPASAGEVQYNAPVAERISTESGELRAAIFAGGCFWGIEGIFSHVKGVKRVQSGYHGGRAGSATYRQVVTGFTNHAEAVRVVYDPDVVRYDELLQIFFSVGADPTLLNRQGPDVGAHYRTALVPLGAEQRAVAKAYLAQMKKSDVWDKPIVAAIEPHKKFYVAEDYHQDFMAKNPRHSYILAWDKPKIEALAKIYPQHFRSEFLRDDS
ncbi:peptide-methionine (S)-S-oxide reductase MsrA [Erythrobacter sp. HA6-11]